MYIWFLLDEQIYSWFFFFSSRRRHTRCSRDWSSDVCSSDLFSRAAGALFITPSGLSVLIRELETQLGFRLFDRTTRHVAPTAYGTEFLGVARRCLADLDAATARIGRSATHAGQSLTLGAPPLISANIVTQAIKEFRAQQPNLRIQLFDASLTTVRQMVEAGKLDMGLGTILDRKSTRLNSSHGYISYAVFCLKKKNT